MTEVESGLRYTASLLTFFLTVLNGNSSMYSPYIPELRISGESKCERNPEMISSILWRSSDLYLMSMDVMPLYVCAPHSCKVQGSQKRMADPLGLELQTVASHRVGPGNCTWVLCKNSCALNYTPAPRRKCYKIEGTNL